MIKKRFVMVLTASVLAAAPAATVMAEGPEMGSAPSISGQQVPGSGESQTPQMNNQAPQMNNQAPQTGDQAPQMNNQAPQMGNQVPQMNGRMPQMRQGRVRQTPQMNNRGTKKNDGTGKRDLGHISFDELLKNGTISQETYDAIKSYMEKKQDLLGDLLANGIITQEEYDAISSASEASRQNGQTGNTGYSPDTVSPDGTGAQSSGNITDTQSAGGA